jgi:hypothetical protein
MYTDDKNRIGLNTEIPHMEIGETPSEYIKKLREQYGMCVFSAKKKYEIEKLLLDIHEAKTIPDIKNILVKIVNML